MFPPWSNTRHRAKDKKCGMVSCPTHQTQTKSYLLIPVGTSLLTGVCDASLSCPPVWSVFIVSISASFFLCRRSLVCTGCLILKIDRLYYADSVSLPIDAAALHFPQNQTRILSRAERRATTWTLIKLAVAPPVETRVLSRNPSDRLRRLYQNLILIHAAVRTSFAQACTEPCLTLCLTGINATWHINLCFQVYFIT